MSDNLLHKGFDLEGFDAKAQGTQGDAKEEQLPEWQLRMDGARNGDSTKQDKNAFLAFAFPLRLFAPFASLRQNAAGIVLVLIGVVFFGWAVWSSAQRVYAQSDHICSAAYRVDETLPTGSRWEMCWEHRGLEGIVLWDIYFTPPGGPRRLVLAQAKLAQVHVPYDDNGARFHDISDFGFGGVYLDNLASRDCPDGSLIQFGTKNVLCKQVQGRGYAQKYYAHDFQGYQLSLFSVNMSGDYNYISQWIFKDDGTIEPTIGAAGRLQRYTTDTQYGWRTAVNRIPVSHYHNYWFRLDFDIDGLANDLVEEIQFNPADSNRRRVIDVEPILTETARDHDPNVQRSWRILDTLSKNGEGRPISYHIEGLTSGHQFNGPDFEPFTFHDIYITRANGCERFASHNPTTGGCAGDMSGFVNGENVNGADVVIWYGITFHHLPREEEEPNMDIHWDSFTIVPRDWTGTNQLGPATPSPPATQPTATSTPTPTATVEPLACTNLLVNAGFENASAWTFGNTDVPAGYVNAPVHGGARALRTGITLAEQNASTYSSAWQMLALPQTEGTLRLRYWEQSGVTGGVDGADYRESILLNGSGGVLRVLNRATAAPASGWVQRTFDVTEFAGQTVRVYFNTYNNGAGGFTWMYVDDVVLELCGEDPPETPAIQVNPRYITLLEPNLPITLPLHVLATAPGPQLNWTAAVASEWFTVSATSGITPAELTVTILPSAQAGASYTGTVTISALPPSSTVAVTIPIEITVLRGLDDQIYLPAVQRE